MLSCAMSRLRSRSWVSARVLAAAWCDATTCDTHNRIKVGQWNASLETYRQQRMSWLPARTKTDENQKDGLWQCKCKIRAPTGTWTRQRWMSASMALICEASFAWTSSSCCAADTSTSASQLAAGSEFVSPPAVAAAACVSPDKNHRQCLSSQIP